MTIKRQYSLPNCTLILEGLTESEDEDNSGSVTEQPPMSILVNAECHFLTTNQSVSGGRVFLDSLVSAVSAYTQELLSGLSHPQNGRHNSPIVHLERIGHNHLHRLIVEPEPESNQERTEVQLTTVQLFDLVEAIDQFFADNKTLPDLSLELQPLSKRHRQAEEPLVERAIPAALGITSLAALAFVFYMIPPPEIKEPQPQTESNPSNTIPSLPQPQAPGGSRE
jgi:hypothetical protein